MSPTLDKLSDGAERLFWRLTTKADDYGRFDADPRVVLGACFPLRIGRMPVSRVAGWLSELAADLVEYYTVTDRTYGQLRTFHLHQRKRDSKPKYPGPECAAASGGELPRVAAYIENVNVNENVNGPGRNSRRRSPAANPGQATTNDRESIEFQIPASIQAALARCSKLGVVGRLREDATWWQAQIRAHRTLDLAQCVLEAESWLLTRPEKASRRKNLVRFLHNWFAIAEQEQRE